MRAAPWTWPARSPSGCRACGACCSWGPTSTPLTRTVCAPCPAPPAEGGLGPFAALPALCFTDGFGSSGKLAEPPCAWYFLLVCCCVKRAEPCSVQSRGDGMRLCLYCPVVPIYSKIHSAVAHVPTEATTSSARVACGCPHSLGTVTVTGLAEASARRRVVTPCV